MMRDDDEIPADLRDLFAAARAGDDGPPAGAKERVASALAVTLGIGIGAAATAATSAAGATMAGAGTGSGAATAAGASGAATATTTAASVAAGTGATTGAGAGFTATGGALAKGLAFVFATAVAGTTGTAIYLAAKDESAKPAIVEVAPSAEVPSTFDPKMLGKKPLPPLPVADKPIVNADAPVIAAEPTVTIETERALVPLAPIESTPEAKAERLRGERAILDTARAAVARGEGGAALVALEAHRSTYPGGALVEERDALTILALAKLGRTEEAKKKADAFRERNPHSLFLKAIDGALR